MSVHTPRNKPRKADTARSPSVLRAQAIRRVAAELQRKGSPRLQMMLMVSLTGGFGLLASYTLLQQGLHAMALRYPLSLLLAYLFFLFLLWVWMGFHTRRGTTRESSDLPVDIPLELPSLKLPGGGDPGGRVFRSGGGGDFAGAGASGSFDGPAMGWGAASEAPLKSLGKVADAGGDADDLAVPLLAIALLAALVASVFAVCFYVVNMAPVLLAEVLVDGVLSYALFQRMRAEDRPLWVMSVVRRTALPVVLTALVLAGAGLAMALYVPGAHSVGQFLDGAKARAEKR